MPDNNSEGIVSRFFRWLFSVRSVAFLAAVSAPLLLLFEWSTEFGGVRSLVEVLRERTFSWHQFYLIASGVVAGFALVLAFRQFEPREREELAREVKFYFLSSPLPLLLGGSMSLILVTIFLTLPHPVEETGYSARYEASLSIYMTTMGVILGLYSLFKSSAPIVDWNQLTRMLKHDLERLKESGGEVWVVYPALNIAYYRNIFSQVAGGGLPVYAKRPEGEALWERMVRNPLREVAEAKDCSLKAITLSLANVQKLFHTYSDSDETRLLEDTEKQRLATDLYENAKKMHETLFCSPTTQDQNNWIKYAEPQAFPGHVIVIGEIVYSISTYGLPIFVKTEGGGDFRWPGTSHEPLGEKAETSRANGTQKKARLLAYRRKDPIIADHVRGELELLWRGCEEAVDLCKTNGKG